MIGVARVMGLTASVWLLSAAAFAIDPREEERTSAPQASNSPRGETVLLETRRTPSSGVTNLRRVTYLGEGWRNLRMLQLESSYERSGDDQPLRLSRTAYYFCGEQVLVYQSEFDQWESDEYSEIIGVSPNEEVLTLGTIVGDVRQGVLPYVAPEQVPSFLSALTPVCNAPPQTVAEPRLLALADSDDSVYHFVGRQFERTGGLVVFWAEQRYTRTTQLTSRPRDTNQESISWEATVMSPARGYRLVHYQADCENRRLGLLRSIEYEPNGTPRRNGGPIPLQQVVPNSVGEGLLQLGCLIR